MRDANNIRELDEQRMIEWMGFIFYPKSPRYVQEKPEYLPMNCKRIGVFVNEKTEVILRKAEEYKLDGIQLHGKETPEFCFSLKGERPDLFLIKAFSINKSDISQKGPDVSQKTLDVSSKTLDVLTKTLDVLAKTLDVLTKTLDVFNKTLDQSEETFREAEAYEEICDFFLFDTATKGYGGSGKQFDWNKLKSYHGSTPFLLSGGIRPESVKACSDFHHERFAGFDLNSGFETAPGHKDVNAIKRFIQQLTNE